MVNAAEIQALDAVTLTFFQPQNEYIERFQKQHGKR